MPDLEYNVEADVNVSELNKISDELDQITGELDDMANELDDVTDAADDASGGLSRLGKAGGALQGLGNFAGGLINSLSGITGLIGGAVSATQDWTLKIDNLAKTTGASIEEATGLATSFELAGFAFEDAESFISGFQGRLIDELEAQKEAQKEIAAIQKERASLLKEMGSAESEHIQTIADLEAERTKIGGAEITKRRAEQQQELADLAKDHNHFLEDQRAAEEKETQEFEDIWEERTRIFEQKSEQLRNELSEKNRSARNVREFLAAQDEFKDKQKLLEDDLNEGRDKEEKALQEKLDNIRQTTEREKELFNERTAAVNQSADEEVAQLEEANAEALANLEERIAAENEAYADRTQGFQDQMAELSEAEAEAASAGGGLLFMFDQLGLSAFNADGSLKNSVQLIGEMQEAFKNMEDEGARAAFLADLGLDAENAAYWMTEGASATEALQYAQEKGLVPTQESIDAIREQNRLLAELKLSALGVGMEMGLAELPMKAVKFAMEKINEATAIVIGLWDQLKTITSLLWEKLSESEAFQTVIGWLSKMKDWIVDVWENVKMLFESFSADGLGSIGESLLGILPGFETGVRSVPGTGPQLAVVHGGEQIQSRSQVLSSQAAAGSGGSGSIEVNINAPVYGVSDLEAAIANGIRQADMQRSGMGVAA